MGILPLEFLPGESAESWGLTGTETYAITGLDVLNGPERSETVVVTAGTTRFEVRVRLDTDRDAAYYRHGGITPYVLRKILAESPG